MSGDRSAWTRGDVVFLPDVLSAVDAHVRAAYPNEGCGYAVGPASSPGVTGFVPMDNLQDRYHAADPAEFPRTARRAYQIHPLEFARAVEAGRARGMPVKVIVHSHADHDAYFSAEDLAFATAGGAPTHDCAYLVVSVRDGRVRDRKLFAHDGATFVETPLHTEETLPMKGFVIWFTGLSGAGKSTLTGILAPELREKGLKVEILDGDEVRTNLSKGLGFSKEDRDTNIRRIGWVAHLLQRNGVCVITAAISPYKEIRDENRALIKDFVEVYVECPIPALADRDVKGLYKKALAGEIKNFTGVSDPYEPPTSPEVNVRTDRETPRESADKILARLRELGYVA
jgi:adenylyl-sulfate kinase